MKHAFALILPFLFAVASAQEPAKPAPKAEVCCKECKACADGTCKDCKGCTDCKACKGCKTCKTAKDCNTHKGCGKKK